MTYDELLRQKIGVALAAGKLPDRRPDRTWGSRGDGAGCAICNASIRPDETALELEYASEKGADNYHVHLACFTAWALERGKRKPASTTTPGARERPAVRAIDDR